MPQGDQSLYTAKEDEKAEEHIEARGVSQNEAGRSARETVNKNDSGDNGGKLGGNAAAFQPASARSKSAKTAAAPWKGYSEISGRA